MTTAKQNRSGESALSRWSRRKLEAERAADEAGAAAEIDQAASGDGLEARVDSDAPPLTDADMPDVATLTADSDFSAFMSPGVSDELRNLALRKLFHAPVFNIRDGLDEYDDDFTSFEKLGDIVTADMKHRVEMEQKKLAEAMARDGEAADAVDEARASDYTDEIEEGVEDGFDDEPVPAQAVAEADAKANNKDTPA